jgi:hypothetical protein
MNTIFLDQMQNLCKQKVLLKDKEGKVIPRFWNHRFAMRFSDGQSLQLNRAFRQSNAEMEAIICEQTILWLQSSRSSIGASHELDCQLLDKLPPWLTARVRKVAVAEVLLLRKVLRLRKRFLNMRALDFPVVFLDNEPARLAPVENATVACLALPTSVHRSRSGEASPSHRDIAAPRQDKHFV